MKDTFYVTTPIYYVNGVPHIGHAYTTVACDVIARYHRLRGEAVFFLTGTDEHSQNVARIAEENGVSPEEWTDRMIPEWKRVWERLQISYDDFIRTSEERHTRAAQEFVKALYERGDVYLGTYEGPYCVSCEEFKVEAELVDGQCPIHRRPVEHLSEENYFFRLSKYQDALLRHYEDNPDFVVPEERRNEMLSFIRGGLRDLSVSRKSVTWGIPLPWDPGHVIYVWVDALLNYVTAAGFGLEEGRFRSVWPADVHVMANDIVRFHSVIWPAMLMAAGVPIPRQICVHGYMLVGGEKMSKTRLTGIHPFELVDFFGVDAYRYYFLREITFGRDGSFSWESMLARYNADLANGWGNLASRVLAMVDSYFDGVVPEPGGDGTGVLSNLGGELVERFDAHMTTLRLTDAVASLDEFVREANRYLVEVAPWALAKDASRRRELEAVLYEALEGLRLIALLAFPIMPEAAGRLWEQLGIDDRLEDERLPEAGRWGRLQPGTKVRRGDSLFPRLES
ncbi:MAG: methionine--tRNA ligase [Actinobacteria bacterium]|nr:methionine--tRNA ligase [Actinomycetota bacterium]